LFIDTNNLFFPFFFNIFFQPDLTLFTPLSLQPFTLDFPMLILFCVPVPSRVLFFDLMLTIAGGRRQRQPFGPILLRSKDIFFSRAAFNL